MARPTSGDRRGLLWKLPVAKTKDLGKLGPGLAFGAGCGVGVGIGVFGGAGLGPGFPGVRLGFGAGVGCGVGVGFGYGVGRGVAYDEFRRHSNVGKMSVPSGNVISDLFLDLSAFTERQLVYAIKQLEESAKELEKRLENRKR